LEHHIQEVFVHMLSRLFLALVALMIFSAGHLQADGIDPFSAYDDPDPVGGLDFALAGPMCFTVSGTTDCLENGVMTATGLARVVYNYLGQYELDGFTGQLQVDVYQNGVYQGSGSLTGAVDTIIERTSPSSYGSFDTQMLQMDLTGTLPGLDGAEVNLTNQTPPVTTTTINPSGNGYQISSFFDVFTELSLDGGTSWTPAPSAVEMDLASPGSAPEPGSATLAIAAAIVFLAFSRKLTFARICRRP
jgi:hypothetical protein